MFPSRATVHVRYGLAGLRDPRRRRVRLDLLVVGELVTSVFQQRISTRVRVFDAGMQSVPGVVRRVGDGSQTEVLQEELPGSRAELRQQRLKTSARDGLVVDLLRAGTVRLLGMLLPCATGPRGVGDRISRERDISQVISDMAGVVVGRRAGELKTMRARIPIVDQGHDARIGTRRAGDIRAGGLWGDRLARSGGSILGPDLQVPADLDDTTRAFITPCVVSDPVPVRSRGVGARVGHGRSHRQ